MSFSSSFQRPGWSHLQSHLLWEAWNMFWCSEANVGAMEEEQSVTLGELVKSFFDEERWGDWRQWTSHLICWHHSNPPGDISIMSLKRCSKSILIKSKQRIHNEISNLQSNERSYCIICIITARTSAHTHVHAQACFQSNVTGRQLIYVPTRQWKPIYHKQVLSHTPSPHCVFIIIILQTRICGFKADDVFLFCCLSLKKLCQHMNKDAAQNAWGAPAQTTDSVVSGQSWLLPPSPGKSQGGIWDFFLQSPFLFTEHIASHQSMSLPLSHSHGVSLALKPSRKNKNTR